ncbi:MAG TPA: YbjN domain-containing protein [Methylovirgula sp.]|nr:YbjN domain-containing protein [Methylovirgula sp.]
MRISSPVITSSLVAAGLLLASYQLAAAQAATPQNAPPSSQNVPPAAAPAATDNITSVTPDQMAAIMRDAGYKADVYEFGTTTKHKAVATAMEGYKVRVYFYSCDAQNKCGSLNFETSFTKSPNFTLALTNKWNAEHRYTKLYIDPSDGSLNFDFDIFVYGGVTPKTIKDAVTLYDGTLGDLAKFLP